MSHAKMAGTGRKKGAIFPSLLSALASRVRWHAGHHVLHLFKGSTSSQISCACLELCHLPSAQDNALMATQDISSVGDGVSWWPLMSDFFRFWYFLCVLFPFPFVIWMNLSVSAYAPVLTAGTVRGIVPRIASSMPIRKRQKSSGWTLM